MIGVDHLVVAARTLDDGIAWCEATLGVVPEPGGKHPLMGTHNRLLSVVSGRFPAAYLELIAIDPAAPPPGRARWFDLDQPAMQRALEAGPQLVHWVLRCDDDIDARCRRLRTIGIERGEVLAASRGRFAWRIGVRPDGARLADGALPTLIAWDGPHPTDELPVSGVSLQDLACAGLQPAAAQESAAPGVRFVADGPPLALRLDTPRGEVTLRSIRIP